jgi:hypothetical protein
MFGVLEQLDLRKMLSSYQRLKFKKDLAVKVAEELKEDIEFVILYPHTARAKNIRREVKEKQNG